jgi:hypothetical protein
MIQTTMMKRAPRPSQNRSNRRTITIGPTLMRYKKKMDNYPVIHFYFCLNRDFQDGKGTSGVLTCSRKISSVYLININWWFPPHWRESSLQGRKKSRLSRTAALRGRLTLVKVNRIAIISHYPLKRIILNEGRFRDWIWPP